jgi:high-affinity iron transporter
MLAAGLVGLREGIEAALIIGILMGYLAKIGQRRQMRVAWGGVAAALLLSALLAVGITAVGGELQGRAEQLFEGTTMFLAVAMLTGMFLWMRMQARSLKPSLERELRTALEAGHTASLFGVAFIAIFREGVETALFLSASAFASNGLGTLAGALAGLAAAAVIGWAIYVFSVRLNLKPFFNVTSVALLFFAAGLLGLAVHEYQEAGLLPLTIAHVWDLTRVMDDSSGVGVVLKTLVGYNSSPSLLEVLSYLAYWVLALVGVRWWVDRRAAKTAARAAA